MNAKTRLVYLSNPNNPTGRCSPRRPCAASSQRCEAVGAYLLADEVYLGAEIHCPRTPSFWGMSDRVIVTSGLSKAYGIPGVRIGWIVGPREVVAECWSQHDYLTIGPNKISDAVARVAVQPENREKLYARTRAILQHNLPMMREWVAGFGGFLDVPRAAGRRALPGAVPLADAELPAVRADSREPERADRPGRAPGAGRIRAGRGWAASRSSCARACAASASSCKRKWIDRWTNR